MTTASDVEAASDAFHQALYEAFKNPRPDNMLPAQNAMNAANRLGMLITNCLRDLDTLKADVAALKARR